MILKTENLTKVYQIKKGFLGSSRGTLKAVDRVGLSLPKGENLSLVGESGCGKSTFARMILRLIPSSEGAIYFDGHDISLFQGEKLKDYRRNVQMVFQDPYNSLDPRFTVKNILGEALQLMDYRKKTPSQVIERMEKTLESVNLKAEHLWRYPHEFSGGERQRIAIARALVVEPRLLILDEAVSSLDVLVQQQILDLLARLQSEYQLTYLFISHNLRVVKKIAHRIAVMYEGRIVEIAPTAELFGNPLHPYTKELLSAAMDYKAIRRMKDTEIAPEAKLVEKESGHFVLEG